jgi:hypothetical protein
MRISRNAAKSGPVQVLCAAGSNPSASISVFSVAASKVASSRAASAAAISEGSPSRSPISTRRHSRDRRPRPGRRCAWRHGRWPARTARAGGPWPATSLAHDDLGGDVSPIDMCHDRHRGPPLLHAPRGTSRRCTIGASLCLRRACFRHDAKRERPGHEIIDGPPARARPRRAQNPHVEVEAAQPATGGRKPSANVPVVGRRRRP